MTRYLLVDDNVPVRQVLARCIAEASPGAEFKHADAAKAALEAHASWKPDVVFTGMGLAHGESGLPLVVALLKQDPKCIVVLCTSMPSEHLDVRQALSEGAFAYVPKPVRSDAVRHVLIQVGAERGHLRRIP
jgi:DNA-binding NtrC family response regulator